MSAGKSIACPKPSQLARAGASLEDGYVAEKLLHKAVGLNSTGMSMKQSWQKGFSASAL